jgi:uncharacterized membrane protein YgdD (TMEM256/DUF423 family)
MDRTFVLIGAGLGFMGVALGAFGAHAHKGKVDADMLAVFETGVRYQFYHALALLIVGWACAHWTSPAITAAGWLFVAGTALFSGSLYALALTGVKSLGAITPIGGVCFLAGWACLAWAAWRG